MFGFGVCKGSDDLVEEAEQVLRCYRRDHQRAPPPSTSGSSDSDAMDHVYHSTMVYQPILAFALCKLLPWTKALPAGLLVNFSQSLTLPCLRFPAVLGLLRLIFRVVPRFADGSPPLRLPPLGFLRAIEFAMVAASGSVVAGAAGSLITDIATAAWRQVLELLLFLPGRALRWALPRSVAKGLISGTKVYLSLIAMLCVHLPLAVLMPLIGHSQALALASAARRARRFGMPLLRALQPGASRAVPRWDVPEGLSVPHSLVCPITLELFWDPCVLYGTVFERDAIEEWLLRSGAHPLMRDRGASSQDLHDAPGIQRLCLAFAKRNGLRSVS